MHPAHVGVDILPFTESHQADPAYVGMTCHTSYMIASVRLLNRSLALGTVLDSHFLLQLLEGSITSRPQVFVFSAGHVDVRLMARGARGLQAIGASVSPRRLGDAIDVSAFRSGTEPQLVWGALD